MSIHSYEEKQEKKELLKMLLAISITTLLTLITYVNYCGEEGVSACFHLNKPLYQELLNIIMTLSLNTILFCTVIF